MRFGRLIASVIIAPVLIGATGPQRRLAPSGPWVLDYADNSCRLSRAFGEGKDQTVLQFESTAPGQMSMVVIGKPLETSLEILSARFRPVQEKAFDGSVQQSTKKEPGGLWPWVPLWPEAMLERAKARAEARAKNRNVRPPPTDLRVRDEERAARQAFAAAARELEISVRRNRPLILETGSLDKPIAAFDRCSRDSLRDWGVDADLEDKIVRPVWSRDVSRWFTSDDYPNRMWQEGKESEVRVRLLVDAAGKPTRCTSLSHFDESEFQRHMCDKFMKRARFEPAELADGTKVPSYYINRIVFRMQR